MRTPDPISIRSLAHRPGPALRALVPALRSMLLGLTVFTAAALTGGVLAGAAPAEPAPQPPPGAAELTSAQTTTTALGGEATGLGDPELVFAYSLIISGTVALALSITGMVIVVRRRRLW